MDMYKIYIYIYNMYKIMKNYPNQSKILANKLIF